MGAPANSRYYSLYLSKLKPAISFYYRIQGSLATYRAEFPANIKDGAVHTITLRVKDQSAELRVDGTVTQVTLDGIVDDCAKPRAKTCMLHVGQRAGGLPFTGGC